MADEIKKVEKEIKRDFKKFFKNYWAVVSVVLAILLVVVLVYNSVSGISGKEAGEKILGYLAENSNGQVNASIVEITDKGSVYEILVAVNGQEMPVYVTKDGKNFVPPGYLIPFRENVPESSDVESTEVPKSDKPKVDLYVMSFCPYGNEAENTLLPVYNLLKDKVELGVHYIVSVGASGNSISSLHGQKEVEQNEREACVLRDYGLSQWFNFAVYVNNNCGSDGACWQNGAKQYNLDVSKINSCVSSSGLSLMKADAEASTSAGASGSPTLVINGVQTNSVYQYGNSEAYKQAVCSAFNNQPSECSQVLDASSSAPAGSC